MKKIKTIKGTTLLSDAALELKPFALQFYGERFSKVIDETLERTVLYEWTNESKLDIVREIACEDISQDRINFNTKQYEENTNAFHFVNLKKCNGFEHAVVVKTSFAINDIKAILAHELYGHAVCSNINNVIMHNKNISMRNGISINNMFKLEEINSIANEGMIEYIAIQIMKLFNSQYKRSNKVSAYKEAVEVANQMFQYVGKDTMLDLLVYNKGCINSLFDNDNSSSWKKLSLELEKKYPEIDDHIDEFVKRYKYKSR